MIICKIFLKSTENTLSFQLKHEVQYVLETDAHTHPLCQSWNETYADKHNACSKSHVTGCETYAHKHNTCSNIYHIQKARKDHMAYERLGLVRK